MHQKHQFKNVYEKIFKFDIVSKDPRERIPAIEGVEVKFTWDNMTTEWENITNNLKKGTLDLNEARYQKIDDKFNRMISQ